MRLIPGAVHNLPSNALLYTTNVLSTGKVRFFYFHNIYFIYLLYNQGVNYELLFQQNEKIMNMQVFKAMILGTLPSYSLLTI